MVQNKYGSFYNFDYIFEKAYCKCFATKHLSKSNSHSILRCILWAINIPNKGYFWDQNSKTTLKMANLKDNILVVFFKLSKFKAEY